MYWNKMLEDPGFNYQTVRALAPYLNSIDEMPNEFKINTHVNLNR
jgi:hypothetical protein